MVMLMKRNGYVITCGRYSFDQQNDGDTVLDFPIDFDLALASMYFDKKKEHLLTVKGQLIQND